MKKIFILLSLIICIVVFSQDLPTEPQNGFAFPLGSKFTIKLYPKDSLNFDYSIIKYEPFQEIIDRSNNDDLFEEKGENGTIEFYFCLGSKGDGEEEREKNMRVLLLIQNRTEYSLDYISDILKNENGEFENTSNVGMLSNVKTIEIWPYSIYQIALHDIKKSK